MKKIVIRSGMSPTEVYTAEDLYLKDRTGYNNGNLAYQYSVYRTLGKSDIEMHSDNLISNPHRADYLNENYEAYIMPLADAFREDFRSTLKNYTKLIKKLKIPVIVIGVGLRANYEPELEKGFPFDPDVKEFVKAVLEKSNQIGVRGQITADYLKKLGFIEEKDYTVIGCPSLYTFGKRLHIRDLHLKKDSLLTINASPLSRENTLKFLNHLVEKDYPNYYFIIQHLDEFYMMYAGGPNIDSLEKIYPTSIHHKYYQEGRVRYFTNMPKWFEFMRQADFSIGSRLHGNIIATIVGTPNISFVQDARMRELTDYHRLPHVKADELEGIPNLETLLKKVDIKSAEKVQERNFNHFIHFLKINNLNHVYGKNKEMTEAPLDKKIAEQTFPESVTPITSLPLEGVLTRVQISSQLLKKRHQKKLNYENNIRNQMIQKLEKELKKTNQLLEVVGKNLEETSNKLSLQLQKNKKLSTENLRYKGTLNRKSVKLSLRTKKGIAKLKQR